MTVGFINHNYSTRNYVTKDSYNYHPYMSYEKIEDKINYLNSKLKSIQ